MQYAAVCRTTLRILVQASQFCGAYFRFKLNCNKPLQQLLFVNPVFLHINFILKMDDIVIKSANDKKKYRVITLENGLTALLISDLEDATQEEPVVNPSPVSAGNDSGHESEDSESVSEDDDQISEDEIQADSQESNLTLNKKKVKMAAAALCIGVGSFSDPLDLPGLAHFLEHMVFMGSEKYPDENAYDAFISKHGGSNNAFTDCERTVFNMEVTPQYFREALDIFAHCFTSPLLKVDSMDREIEAVDSEFQLNAPIDSQRRAQIFGSLAKEGHPMAKFMWGNTKSLKEIPLLKNIDVNECLQKFYKRYYSAHYMTLAVQSTETLEILESWVREAFSGIPNNGLPLETFKSLLDPFKTEKFNKLYKVVPVRKTHQVVISWALPPVEEYYRVKPLDYLGWLVGHEGRGSILAFLKKRSWAISLEAGNNGGGFEQNTTYSLFSISIVLTEDGMGNILEVLKTVFQYLEMLRAAGPQERIYEELRAIKDMAFRFKADCDSVEYVENVSENMQRFPPEHYLVGNELYFDYDEEMIKSCQDSLTADKANIIMLSSNFSKDECLEVEPWTKCNYSCSDIPQDWIGTWKDMAFNSQLYLPEPNKFIASDFSLKHQDEPVNEYPVKLYEDKHSRIWYKEDVKFKVPKAYMNFVLISSHWYSNPSNSAMIDLFCHLLYHVLSEDAYPAEVAELSYSVYVDSLGLVIKVCGFNHKLPVLLETVLDYIANFEVNETVFNTIKKHLSEKYHNSLLKPQKLCRDLRQFLVIQENSSLLDKSIALESVTIDMLTKFMNQCFTSLFIESLMQGNITSEEAIIVNRMVKEKLKIESSQVVTFPELRVKNIPEGETFCRVSSFNKEDQNSAIINYYQLGPTNIKNACMMQLLMAIMHEPCFDTLRTNEQLGYDVNCFLIINFGILGFILCVYSPSTKFRCSYVDERIEAFLDKFSTDMLELDNDKFQAQLQSLIQCKKCEDLHLREEVDRNWVEVKIQRYMFDKQKREIASLESLSLDEFKIWMKNGILFDTKRKKLGLQVAGPGEVNNIAVLNANESFNGGKEDIKSLVYLTDDSKNTHSKFITSIYKFKNSLESYPVCKITS